MKRIIFLLLPFLHCTLMYSQNGILYHDVNLNGIRDTGEKGICGVVVSDGFTLTRTDSKGQFTLDCAQKARFITVYTPSGYRHTSPYYIDIRDSIPTDLEFGLAPAESVGEFIHFSDIEERSHLDWMDEFITYLSTRKVDFVAITGDICYAPGLHLNGTRFNSEQLGVRTVYTLGNHDLIKGYQDPQGRDYGEKLYEDYFGPCWYAFNVAGVHYMVTPMLSGDARPSYTPEEVYAWMQADLNTLPEGTPVVIFNHGLLDLDFPAHNILAYIYGHHHINYHCTGPQGIQMICTIAPNKGGNDHSPSCWRLFSYQASGLTNQLHYYPMPKHIAAQVHARNDSLVVHAIVYDGRSDTQAVTLLHQEQEIALTPVTDFLWTATLPQETTSLPTSALRIRATFSDGETRLETVKQQPGIVWKKQFAGKAALGSPIIDRERVYVPLVDDQMSEHCGISCLDKESGELLWHLKTSGSVRNEMVLSDGRLYAADVNSELYAIDPATGRICWQYRFRDQGFYPSNTQGICYHEGRLYVGQGEHLVALNAEDGTVIWKNSTGKSAGITDVSTYVVADGVLCVNAYWVGRYGLDAATGELLWEKHDSQNRYSTGTPVFENGKLYYTAYQSLIEMDPRSGEETRRVKQGHIFNTRSRLSIQDGIAVVGTSNHGMTAYRMEDFSECWNTTTMPALIYTSPYTKSYEMSIEGDPVAYGENLIFGANDGYVYCISREKGAFVWRHEIGLPILANPVVDGEFLYILDMGGGFTKLRISELFF